MNSGQDAFRSWGRWPPAGSRPGRSATAATWWACPARVSGWKREKHERKRVRREGWWERGWATAAVPTPLFILKIDC